METECWFGVFVKKQDMVDLFLSEDKDFDVDDAFVNSESFLPRLFVNVKVIDTFILVNFRFLDNIHDDMVFVGVRFGSVIFMDAVSFDRIKNASKKMEEVCDFLDEMKITYYNKPSLCMLQMN